MSGVKCTTVTMSQARADELRSRARRADTLESQNRILQNADRQRERRLSDLQRQMAESDRHHARHAARLGEELQALERSSRQALQRQREETQAQIRRNAERQRAYTDQCVSQLEQKVQRQFAEQRQEYRQLISEQGQRFESALREQGATLQQNIDALASQLRDRWEREQDLAEAWQGYLREEITFIREAYRHELFAPGRLAEIEQRLVLVDGNLQRQVYQAGIAGAQEAYLQARRLREALELAELRWQQALAAAQDSVTTALLLLDEQERIDYRLENDASLSLEVDYWSAGAWRALRDEVEARRQALESGAESLRQEELERLVEFGFEAGERLAGIVADAKTALLSSVHRHDLQEQILERLEELGYRLVDSTYAAEDYREAYHLQLENGHGDQIVTVVTPGDRTQAFANDLAINFYDQSPNEAVRQERLELIQRLISGEEGLEIAPLRCESGYETGNAPAERRDFTALRAAQPAPRSTIR